MLEDNQKMLEELIIRLRERNEGRTVGQITTKKDSMRGYVISIREGEGDRIAPIRFTHGAFDSVTDLIYPMDGSLLEHVNMTHPNYDILPSNIPWVWKKQVVLL